VIQLGKAARDRRLLGASIAWRPAQLGLLDSLDGPESLHLWCVARQCGKTSMAAAAAIANAALRDDLDAMLPHGRWRYVPVISPSEDQSRDFTRVAEALVEASPVLAGYAEVSAGRIDFRLPRVDEHGGRWTAKTSIRALPANSRSMRGLTSALVVAEEMAHWRSDTGGEADERRIWGAITPMQVAFGKAAKVLCLSTPWGEDNLFAELLKSIEGGVIPSARAVRASIVEMWPEVDRGWLEGERAKMGEDAYRTEYLAELVASGGSFFDLRGVGFEDAPARPSDGRRYVAGLDPAFHADRFGVALVGESVNEPGVLVTGVVDGIEPGARRRSLDARRGREDATLARVWELLEPYAEGGGLRIVTDQHQGDAVGSYFGRLGVSVKVVNLTGPLQTAAFTSTRARLMDGSLRLWRHEPLLEELRRVRARDTEAIVLPRFGGSHCDIASALALAVYEQRHVTGAPQGKPHGGASVAARLREVERTRGMPAFGPASSVIFEEF